MAIFTLVSIIFVHIFVVSRTIFFPYPELFVYPYLTNIGLSPYAQILDQHFPGVMFLPLNLGNMGFSSVDAMFLLHIAIIAINHVLIFLVTRSLLKTKNLVLIANIFYALWHPYMEGYVLWIDSFMPLMLLPAFYFFVHAKHKSQYYFYISAVFLGLALVFKQVVLPLILLLSLYIWLITKKFRKAFVFGLISGVPMGLVSLYYMNLGVFNNFFYWTVTFNLTTFADLGRKHATFTEIIKMLAIFSPGVIYLLLNLKKKTESVLMIFLLGSLMFAYARFDFVHTQPALAFLAIIITILVSKLPKFSRNNIVVIYILVMIWPISSRLSEIKGNETLFFTDLEEELIEHVDLVTDEGDTIFVFGTTPHLYYMTNTRPPSDVFVFHFPWFLLEAEDRILQGIKNDPPKIVIRNQKATTSGMNLVQYGPNINEYISKNYSIQDKIGDTEILVPNEANKKNSN